MATTLGKKGRLVLGKPILDALGAQPGYLAVQTLIENRVEIRFFPPEHRRSLRGVLAGATRRQVPPEEWEKAREEAWEAAVRESESRK